MMTPPAPQSSGAKQPGGVFPISAVTSQQNSGADAKANSRGPPQRLKVVIRRLPPGLTLAELEDALGGDWKAGQGKVSWVSFKPGKITKDLSKPSRPARAYFQLTQQSHLETFAEKVRQTSFLDARSTANDASLLGPPILEFAPYGRVASGKKRNDVRQGLIDQDPEFIAFLESLTNPTPKVPTMDGVEAAQQKEDAAKVTPLIQYLRDKKAAKEAGKEKEKTAAKANKHNRQVSKNDASSTTSTGASKSTTQNSKAATEASEKKGSRAIKTEKVTKQSPKPAKKDIQAVEPKTEAAAPSAKTDTVKASENPSKRPEKSSQASAAARMIQRDLGIRGRGSPRGRGGRQTAESNTTLSSSNDGAQDSSETNGKKTAPTDASPGLSKGSKSATAETVPKPAILKREGPAKSPKESASKVNPQSPATTTSTGEPSSPAAATQSPSTAPISTSTPGTDSAATATKQKPKAPKPQPAINPNATHAFLKHANPSQGVTEPLILAALSVFGEVSHVEIDKRKGFAYVDFVEPDGLQKAIKASPVKVAQGSVQVLERKDRAPAAVRGGGGGNSSAQGRGGTSSAAPAGPRNVASAGPTGSLRGRGRGRGGHPRGGANSVATHPTAAPTSNSARDVQSTPIGDEKNVTESGVAILKSGETAIAAGETETAASATVSNPQAVNEATLTTLATADGT